ncbi:MAG: DUF1816 domain-containing protein [Cyanophyceae cyanobacterium]
MNNLTNFFKTLPVVGRNMPWWVKIQTTAPQCTYYFGPFASAREAKNYRHGYVEDLAQEKAQGIAVAIERCQPKLLTIYDE